MNPRNIKPLRALAVVVGVIPVIGVISAIVCHDVSMFYWSLAAAAAVAVLLPAFLFVTFVLSSYAGAALGGLLIAIQRLFTRK